MEKQRVLVIDDDFDALVLATSVLGQGGYEVQSAVDIRQALEEAVPFRPQVVLLDHRLPVQPGLDAVDRLRREPSLAGARIVLTTSARFSRAEVAHLDGYLQKPWTPDELFAAIESACGHPGATGADGQKAG